MIAAVRVSKHCALIVLCLTVHMPQGAAQSVADGIGTPGTQSADTLSRALENLNVKGRRVRSFLTDIKGSSAVSMEMMEQMPRILGNADPMHYAQLLPGVQTNSEYDAGLHIQGSDNSHNQAGIEGVPLYNVAHLLGFFSVFNATHFSYMHLQKTARASDSPNRLGGTVDMRNRDDRPDAAGGDLSVGPMSSQGTLRIPVGSRSSITLSARAAYLNLLYSQWLKIDDSQMRYSFCDYNLNYTVHADDRNTIWADAYYGNDDVGFDDDTYEMDASLKWSNAMGALHWRHEGTKATFEQCAYYTGYRNRFRLGQTNVSVRLSSDISDIGYKGRLTSGPMTVGADIVWHSIQPQNPQTEGVLSRAGGNEPRQSAVEASLYADRQQPLGDKATITFGLRTTLYRCGDRTFAGADPIVSAALHTSPYSTLTLSGGVKHQYIFKTGFSDVGLPTEFWMASDAAHRPQYSYNASLLFETSLRGKAWRISAEAYYKRLMNQTEYEGNVFDFIYSDYDLDNMLLHGNGHNYGLNLMVERRKGRLTGWISYSVGRSLRHFPGTRYDGWYPASHERIHELNAVATLKAGRRWSFGATMVAASGTPYTAAEKFYMISTNVITEFGEHNGRRVPPYMRVDVSASYDFRVRKGRKSGINLSVYNLTRHSNPLFYRLKIYNGRFANKPFNFILNIMPSVNYYYSF